MIAPNTDIYLLKVPIEIDEMNQLTFSDIHSQYNYFMSCEKLYLDNATYQRKDNVIRYPSGDNYDTNFDQLQKYNYCCYRNDSYSDRVFYAFIKNMRYVNDGMTEIEIETDVFQTWQFDIVYKSSLIEREHVNNDGIGVHTVPEGLETGPYISYGEPQIIECMNMGNAGNSNHCLCMGITSDKGSIINNQYSGLSYIFFKDISTEGEAWALLNMYIDENLQGNDEVIQFIMPIPLAMVNNYVTWTYQIGSTGFHYGLFGTSGQQGRKYTAFDLGTYLTTWDNKLGGGYTPKNNKLLCYPYRYLMLTNNVGGNMIYRFEDETYSSAKNRLSFQVSASLVPGLSVICVPQYYKGVQENYSESLIGAKVPLCSWNSDMYTNWLVQNGVNEDLAKTASYEDAKANYNMNQLPFVGGMLAKNSMEASMAEVWQHKVVPFGSRGVNGGDVNFSLNNLNFKVYDFVIKNEYAKLIDDYFSTYGYKVNAVKTPNVFGRSNWNYVKTIECNITGDIPQGDMQKLKDIFNQGVTFWHNPNTFLDYSQSNNII